jgi:hypothetical protein
LVHFVGRDLLAYDQAAWARLSDHKGEEPFFVEVTEGGRTLSQNAHIQVLARLLADYTGDSMKYFRDAAVLNVLGLEDGLEKPITVLGQAIRPVKSTRDLNKADGSRVIDWLIALCDSMELRPLRREVEG